MLLLVATPTPLGEPARGLSSSQFELVQWAENRFLAAGLEVPPVVYDFRDGIEACGNHAGIFYAESQSVRMCSMVKDVILHELAHAWAGLNLTSADRAALVARRGLPTWGSHAFGWRERGTEHAAEIIKWALSERIRLVRWTDQTSGQVGFRLLTIDQSAPEQLLRDFRLMTGRDPILRNVSEWADPEALPAVFSPEA